MAVTLTDNRTIIHEGDDTTGWTGTNSMATATSSPTPVESTARIESTVSSATHDFYYTLGSPQDMSGEGLLIYIWMSHRAEFDTTANVGVGIQIGDGTNRVAYGIMGSDAVAFSHSEGPVVWQCLVLDTGNLAAYSSVTIAGSAGSLNLASITQVGLRFKTLVKAVGGAVNVFWDISRFLNSSLNNGAAVTITGGTSGDPGTFEQIAAADRQTGNQQAYGVVRKLGSGLFGIQGALRFGEATGTSSSWFEDKNVTVAFESRKTTTNKYKVVIVDNGTGTTTFKLGTKIGSGSSATGTDAVTIIVPSGVGGSFDSGTDTDVTDVFIYGSVFSGFTNGITLGPNQEFIGCIVSGSGTITANGAVMVNTKVSASTAAADASSLVWNVNTDTNGYLDNMSFSKGTNAHHAIELGTASPTTVTFSGIAFTGFNATNGQNDSAVLVSRTSGTVTINVSGGTSPTYKSAGASVNVVSSVTVTINVKDSNQQNIQNARVYVVRDADQSIIINGSLTDVNGNASGSTVSGAGAITITVRKSSTGTTRYFPVQQTGNVGGSNTTINVALTVDTIASA